MVCLPGTVNVWNPKAVRGSAGSIFRLPVLYAREDVALERLREAKGEGVDDGGAGRRAG